MLYSMMFSILKTFTSLCCGSRIVMILKIACPIPLQFMRHMTDEKVQSQHGVNRKFCVMG